MRTVVELTVGLVLLTAGVVLGALVERSRARAGYLAKRYRDHLVLLLELAHAASIPEPWATTHQHIEPDVMKLLERVERDRAEIEADVRLFGDRAARQKLEESTNLSRFGEQRSWNPRLRG